MHYHTQYQPTASSPFNSVDLPSDKQH